MYDFLLVTPSKYGPLVSFAKYAQVRVEICQFFRPHQRVPTQFRNEIPNFPSACQVLFPISNATSVHFM